MPSGPNVNVSMPSANVNANVKVGKPSVALPSANVNVVMPSMGMPSVSMPSVSIPSVRLPSMPSWGGSTPTLNVSAGSSEGLRYD